MSSCVMSTCVMSICVMSICVMSSCVMSTCVMSICVMSSCVTSIFVMSICVLSICVMSSCVMSICVISICVMSTCVMSICVMPSCVTSIFVMSICAMSSYVMSVCVCVMSVCVVSVCVMSICVMSSCVISICVTSTCVMSICVRSSCVTSIFVMSICAMSSSVMSVCVCVMSICVVSVCVMSICVIPICVHRYPKRNLHTARRQTHMPARHPHKIFAPPIGTATPNAIYTQQGAKPACQQDTHTKFSHLLLAQLPRTQCTHSKAPNPHASKTSTQNFRSSYWHSYPERNLHTARRQTRMAGRHPHKIFASPIVTATPNAIYTQQGAKPACQEDIHAKFSHLLLAQLPRAQFTHSKAPNPNARKTSTQNCRISYCDNYPKRNLHTASRQTRMPAKHPHKIFASPIGAATPSAIYTQQGAKPAWQEDINTKFSHLLLAQLPSPTPATRKQRQSSGDRAPKRTSDPLQCSKSHACWRGRSYCLCSQGAPKRTSDPLQCSKSHACHAKAAAEQRRPRSAKAYIRPPAVQQVPRLPRESSGSAAETKERQSVHQTPCSAASPTPATRKQRQSSGDQGAPKRTSDPLQCSKSRACHAKAGAEQRRPRSAKAYIRPPAVQQVPRLPRDSSGSAAETKERQSVHQTPCSAASPTPATRKQRQNSGDQGAPKRTSDPLQYLQPRDVKPCDVKPCDVKPCDVKLCDVNLCDVNLCAVNLCDVKLCDVNLCDFNLCDVNLCDVILCDVNLCDVNLSDVNLWDSIYLCDVNLCDVNLCDVNLCAVNLWDVNLCDVNLCDVILCDVNLCDVLLCDVNLCDVNLSDVNLWDSICVMSICVTSICVMSICVTSIETEEERGGGGVCVCVRRRQPKNKNPTQQCLHP